MDVLYQAMTYKRQVTVNDTTGPIDPTDMVAVLCPETPMVITPEATGIFWVSLDETTTATLPVGNTHWEFFGRVNGDMYLLTRQAVTVQPTCMPIPAVTHFTEP